MVGRLKHDGAAGAENRIARGRHELTLVVEQHAAVTGIALAGRRLHHQKGGAVDGKIQRIFGLLGGALRKIAEGTAVLDEANAAVASHEVVFVRARLQKFLKQRVIGFVTRRVDVGDVVGDDVQLPFQYRLPRKSDQKRVLHRWFSPERSAAKPSQADCGSCEPPRLSQAAVRKAQSESRASLEIINFTMAYGFWRASARAAIRSC